MIPVNVIATADDFGLNLTVNRAILECFRQGYINSTSFLTNTKYFDESVSLIHANDEIQNVGVHINFAEGKPLTLFNAKRFLKQDGTWNIAETNNKKKFILNTIEKEAFRAEISAQINRALQAGINVTHLDSHYHIHTLPRFYNLFIDAAKKYNLKLRLAQSYNEGNLVKYAFRRFSNGKIITSQVNYSERFETVGYYLAHAGRTQPTIELMLHPDLDESGCLTDHFEGQILAQWIGFLNNVSAYNK